MRVPPSSPHTKTTSPNNGAHVTSAPLTSENLVSSSTAPASVDAVQKPQNDAFVDRMERPAVKEQTPAEQNAAMTTKFYEAFTAKDGKTMASMYDDNAVFSDPAFGTLRGKEIGAMWMMLTRDAPTLKVAASNIQGNDGGATGHWDADYSFGKNPVRNEIDTKLTIKDGKITSHHDSFSFEKWSSQAFGFKKLGGFGRMLSKSGLVQNTFQFFARRQLFAYMEKKGIPRPS